MNKLKTTSAVLAIGAAAVFSLAPVAVNAHGHHCHHGHGHGVKCLSVNGCRGFSSCKTAYNNCKGQNACKGKGFVFMSRHQCSQILGPNVSNGK
ncbi:MAG: hypothetical protein H0T84_06745 [Tatlockia sp.]|nr:hypothetical protein [Tatlockia sp.]